MTLGKMMKKLLSVAMVLVMAIGAVAFGGSDVNVNAASNPVRMHSTEITFCKYGFTNYNVYIEVDANSASNKEVYVHHSTYDRGWVDTEATFYAMKDSNTEIYQASVAGMGATEFVLKYVADGVRVYWDNNNGNNYRAVDMVGTAEVKALPLCSAWPETYCVQAAVKNIAYHKVVKVRYTEDNWATYKETELKYSYSVEGTNSEVWAVDLDVEDTENFQYCISYTVNGRTYWDNNFGFNYDRNFYRAY